VYCMSPDPRAFRAEGLRRQTTEEVGTGREALVQKHIWNAIKY